MSKVIVADRVYIPQAHLDLDKIQKGYERHVYRENTCSRCSNKPDRYNDICATCPAHLGFYKTWKKEVIKGKKYIGLPKGNLDMVKKYTDIDIRDPDFDFVDLRSNVKAKHLLTFTAKLYTGKEKINGVRTANQRHAVKEWWKVKNGLLLSKPRSGKTVMATKLICSLKRRTLFVAHEDELLKQGIKTLRNFTDLRAVEAKTKKKLAGIIQTPKDWENDWDVVFVTYQKFISLMGNKRLRKYVLKRFGFLIIDEVHRGNADAYINFLLRMDTKYNLGLTATDKRKDGKEFLIRQAIGKTVVETDAVGLTPKVFVHFTNLAPKNEWRGATAYVKACSWLAEHKERNVMLIKQIFKDLRENDKNCIVIPVLRVAQAKKLVKLINKQAIFNNENKGEKWHDELAISYLGESDKKRVMQAAREGSKTRVTIAIRQKVQEGVDVIPWTHEYLSWPLNNPANFYQLTQRICTPFEGKPQPVLRIYVDNFGLSIGCFIATWFNGVIVQKYKVDPIEYEKAKAIIDDKKKSSFSDYKPKVKSDGPPMKSMW